MTGSLSFLSGAQSAHTESFLIYRIYQSVTAGHQRDITKAIMFQLLFCLLLCIYRISSAINKVFRFSVWHLTKCHQDVSQASLTSETENSGNKKQHLIGPQGCVCYI